MVAPPFSVLQTVMSASGPTVKPVATVPRTNVSPSV